MEVGWSGRWNEEMLSKAEEGILTGLDNRLWTCACFSGLVNCRQVNRKIQLDSGDPRV